MATIEDLLYRRTDLSTFVVHFTRASGDGQTALENLTRILESQRLEARNVYGMAQALAEQYPEVEATERVVCFTETPLEQTWMMCEEIEKRECRFEGYGLAFTKAHARRHGVNPVWYIDQTPGNGVPGGRKWLTKAVDRLLELAEGDATDGDAVDAEKLADDPALQLTPFFEQMGTYRVRKEFWWEREWRYVGHFDFRIDDVVVLYAPQADHEALQDALGWPRERGRTPAIVDATWGLERIIGALSGVPDLGPFPN